MPRQPSRPILPALLGLLTITALLYYLTLTPTSATKPPTPDAAAPANPLTHLRVSLRQTSTSPPTLTARVTNTHPSTPLTLLTWDTPLDPLALRLGLATVTFGAAGDDEVLAIPVVQVRRKLPPAADAVVVVEPAGGWAEQEFVLEEPVLDVGRIRGGGGRARVGLGGRWAKVWEGREMGMGEGEALSGEWEVGPVEVVV
ncbi:hypothetical protein GTA08_BOTSDO13883 [Neofusicoccum parvum]|uniref:Uncharacterized protein n=1 Tax=Neofusicoccum parvum TaxID=310453 RepID=A0ACB5RTU0_9PEZI|nr:hypothetical protein GTA08_BOTSDO13883 [Neofusicoccum parvum]